MKRKSIIIATAITTVALGVGIVASQIVNPYSTLAKRIDSETNPYVLRFDKTTPKTDNNDPNNPGSLFEATTEEGNKIRLHLFNEVGPYYDGLCKMEYSTELGNNPEEETLYNNKISGIKSIKIDFGKTNLELSLFYGWEDLPPHEYNSNYVKIKSNVENTLNDERPSYFLIKNKNRDQVIEIQSIEIKYSCTATKYYNYQKLSLLDYKKEYQQVFKGNFNSSLNNKRVYVEGTVSKYVNRVLYLQDYYLNEKEYGAINIFCGMAAIPQVFATPNTYVRVYGTISCSESFGLQMTDVRRFPKDGIPTNEFDAEVLIKPEENNGVHKLKTYEYGINDLNAQVENPNTLNHLSLVNVNNPVHISHVNKDPDYTELHIENSKIIIILPYASKYDYLNKDITFKGIFAPRVMQSDNIVYQILCYESDIIVK